MDLNIAPQTLLQFTTNVGNAIRMRPELRSAWVTAEMVDLRVAGGHCYMELIEKDSTGTTVAKLRAMIWRNQLDGIRRKFFAATGRDIGNGLKVMVMMTAGYHPVYGLSATITDIDPNYTLGDLERIRREILARLKQEGLLELNRSKKMPMAPQRIAVISSGTAAGYGDFINQLEGNPSGFVFYPYLFEATMQGERTAQSVIGALGLVEMTIDLWDCVIIIRGGGATTDMNGFDDYELARRVATFPLPVIVGIGHERDRCVLDEIACVRCKTPTAAAGYLVDRLSQAWQLADRSMRAIAQYATDRLSGEKERLGQLSVTFPTAATSPLERQRMLLGQVTTTLPLLVGRQTAAAGNRLDTDLQLIATAARNATMAHHQALPRYGEKLSEAAANLIERHKDRLESFSRLTSALSPQNTLKRGYSVTRAGGKAVRDASALPEGTEIETLLASGRVVSKVLKTESGD